MRPKYFSSIDISTDLSILKQTTPFYGICKQCLLALEGNQVASILSGNSDCNLCQLIMDCGPAVDGDEVKMDYVRDKDSLAGNLVISLCGRSYEHPLRVLARMSPPAYKATSFFICRTLKNPADKHAADWHETLQDMTGLDDSGTNSAAASAMIKHWLRTCVQKHSQCRHKQSSQYSPTRILDLGGSEDNNYLTLLQDVKLDSPYVALSHRWGYEALPSTTTANVAERLQQMTLNELSQTMKDAISIVRKLKYRYLWVDALCIIQDSTTDWFKEASHMSEVFSGAIVTIAVADSTSHTQGIFRHRTVRCTRPFQIPFLHGKPYRERTLFDGENDFYVFPRVGDMGTGSRPKGTLDTRAWILQEQLLSPRILYFDRSEIFWDCIEMSASEMSPISASLLHDQYPDETWALKLIRKTLAESTAVGTLRQRIADVWTQVIQNYSSRELTRPSDKLVALQGVLQPLSLLLKDDPIAGMWHNQLWKQLIWWVAKPYKSTIANSEMLFTAPSWSWLNTHGPVYYHNAVHSQNSTEYYEKHKFMDLEPFIRVVSVEVDISPDATTIHGSLTVCGPSFRYHLTANDLQKPGVKSWNARKLKLNTGMWMLDRPLQFPVEIHCVIMAEDTVAKMLVCLCLVQDEGQVDKWKRIGLCHWDGLAWQVRKYVGHEPKDRVFIVV